MFRFVVWCILGYNESVYLKVIRDVLCEIQNLSNWWIMLFFGVQCRCSKYQVESYTIQVKKQEWKDRGKLL